MAAAALATDSVLGISLGTSYLSACLIRPDGRFDVVCNDQGFRSTPTVIAYGSALAEVFVGDQAKVQRYTNLENTLVDMLAFAGKKLADPEVQALAPELPFTLVEGADGEVAFELDFDDKGKKVVSQADVWGVIFGKIKKDSDSFLELSSKAAVLAIPHHWNGQVPAVLQKAMESAGFELVSTISEPLAMSLALGLDQAEKTPEPRQVVVVDVGGYTSKVSVLQAHQGLLKLQSYAVVAGCSGAKMDAAMAASFAQVFLQENKDIDPEEFRESARARVVLDQACEIARRALSSSGQTTLEVDSLFDGLDLFKPITAVRLRQLLLPVFRPLVEHLRTLVAQGVVPDHVYVVGGCGVMPTLRAAVLSVFEAVCAGPVLADPEGIEYPQTMVAIGAALHATLAPLLSAEQLQAKISVPVTAEAVSVVTASGSAHVVVPAGAVLPAQNSVSVAGPGQLVAASAAGPLASLAVAGANVKVQVGVNEKGEVSLAAAGQQASSGVAPVARPAEQAGSIQPEQLYRQEAELYFARLVSLVGNPKAGFAAPVQASVAKLVAETKTWLAANPAAKLEDLVKQVQAFEAKVRPALVPADEDDDDVDVDSELDGSDNEAAAVASDDDDSDLD